MAKSAAIEHTSLRYHQNRRPDPCFLFSICIPQYNRTDHVLKSLESIANQTFKDFEICISDGGSTDGRSHELTRFLEHSGLSYRWSQAQKNLPYDENIRAAISLSSGRYIFLLGNDDALADQHTLSDIADVLSISHPAAVVTNYLEVGSGKIFRRVTFTGLIGEGPLAAADVFRHYAFVSGILFDGPLARSVATEECDGSEMYQMYLGTRLVAAGGQIFAIDRICIHKDILLPGRNVESYRNRPRVQSWPIRPRSTTLGRILDTVWIGLKDATGKEMAVEAASRVCKQLYQYTYPFWVIEYRRVQSFGYALSVYLALRPSIIAKSIPFERADRFSLWGFYLFFGAAGMLVPIRLFDIARPVLYKLAKRS